MDVRGVWNPCDLGLFVVKYFGVSFWSRHRAKAEGVRLLERRSSKLRVADPRIPDGTCVFHNKDPTNFGHRAWHISAFRKCLWDCRTRRVKGGLKDGAEWLVAAILSDGAVWADLS